MKPPKAYIEAATNDGTIDRVSILCAVQVLHAVSNSLNDEACELLGKHKLLLGPIRQASNNFVRASDRYFFEFKQMVDTPEETLNMFTDIEQVERVIRKWMDRKPVKKED